MEEKKISLKYCIYSSSFLVKTDSVSWHRFTNHSICKSNKHADNMACKNMDP